MHEHSELTRDRIFSNNGKLSTLDLALSGISGTYPRRYTPSPRVQEQLSFLLEDTQTVKASRMV